MVARIHQKWHIHFLQHGFQVTQWIFGHFTEKDLIDILLFDNKWPEFEEVYTFFFSSQLFGGSVSRRTTVAKDTEHSALRFVEKVPNGSPAVIWN